MLIQCKNGLRLWADYLFNSNESLTPVSHHGEINSLSLSLFFFWLLFSFFMFPHLEARGGQLGFKGITWMLLERSGNPASSL